MLTSHSGRHCRSAMKLRRDLAGPMPAGFVLRRFTVGAFPQGHDQIIRTDITAMTVMQQATMRT
jgi:hypothetical protein